MEKQAELQIDALKSLSLPNKINKQINNYKLDYKAKIGKGYNFSKVSLPITFIRDINTNILSIENNDNEKSNLFKKLSDLSKDRKPIKKYLF